MTKVWWGDLSAKLHRHCSKLSVTNSHEMFTIYEPGFKLSVSSVTVTFTQTATNKSFSSSSSVTSSRSQNRQCRTSWLQTAVEQCGIIAAVEQSRAECSEQLISQLTSDSQVCSSDGTIACISRAASTYVTATTTPQSLVSLYLPATEGWPGWVNLVALIIHTCQRRLARLSSLGGPHYTYLPGKVGQAELTWWPSLYLPAREGWPGWADLVALIIPTCQGRLARLSWLGGPHYTYVPEKVGQAELTWWPSLYLPAREGWPGWVNLVVLIIRTCQRRLARLS